MNDAAGLLRVARSQARLSQRALARSAGVKQPAIARIETGRQKPSVEMLRKLVNACGFDLALDLRPAADPHDLGLIETTILLSPGERVRRLLHLYDEARQIQAATARAQRFP